MFLTPGSRANRRRVPNALTPPAVIDFGTINTALVPLTIQGIWNNSNIQFTAIKTNITANAAGGASLLWDFDVGGTPRLQITYVGQFYLTYVGGETNVLNMDMSSSAINLSPAIYQTFPSGVTGGVLISAIRSGDSFQFATFKYYSGNPGIGLGTGAALEDTFVKRGATAGVVSFENFAGGVFVGGTFRTLESTSSTLAAGSTNNYDPTANSGTMSRFQRLTANASNSVLTGFAPNSGAQVSGQEHVIVNVASSGTLTLSHQDSGSLAANRFLCSTGSAIVLNPNQSAIMEYDATTGAWRVYKRN